MEKPNYVTNYVKYNTNHDLIPSSPVEVIGLNFRGIIYNLLGHSAISDAGTAYASMVTEAELNQMKSRYEQQGATFEDTLNDQQLLDAIEAFEDQRNEEAKIAAQEAAATPSADERIAAAMEYANLLNS